jgi:transcriptional regulator with XRE-family HTH domain
VTIGERVRQMRRERGWTGMQLAQRAGIEQAALNRIERGRVQRPQDATLAKIAAAFEVGPETLIAGTTVPAVLPSAVRTGSHGDGAARPQEVGDGRELSRLEQDWLRLLPRLSPQQIAEVARFAEDREPALVAGGQTPS